LIKETDLKTDSLLCRTFLETHPSDAARILEQLAPEEATALLQQFPVQSAAAPVLQLMDTSVGIECLKKWPEERLPEILSAIDIHTAALMMRRMEPPDRDRLLARAPEEVTRSLKLLLRYPENTAGALMDPRILALPEDIDVAEACRRIQKYPEYAYYYIYVVNRVDKLLGFLEIRELLIASRQTLLSSVMRPANIRISTRAGLEALMTHPGWRRFYALPVVDDKDILLGILSYQRLRELEQDTAAKTPNPVLNTAIALGELYWIGAASLIRSLGGVFKSDSAKSNTKESRNAN
jgi:magnesium transporter